MVIMYWVLLFCSTGDGDGKVSARACGRSLRRFVWMTNTHTHRAEYTFHSHVVCNSEWCRFMVFLFPTKTECQRQMWKSHYHKVIIIIISSTVIFKWSSFARHSWYMYTNILRCLLVILFIIIWFYYFMICIHSCRRDFICEMSFEKWLAEAKHMLSDVWCAYGCS